MNDSAPPLHPTEREQLRAESTLVVTVKSSGEFHDDITDSIVALKRDDAVDSTPHSRSAATTT
jgi:predicted transcriptional regulator